MVEGGTLVMYGDPGSWKSWLTIDAAFALAEGRMWLGRYPCQQATVLLIQTEEPERKYKARFFKNEGGVDDGYIAKALRGKQIPMNLHVESDMNLRINGSHNRNRMTDLIGKVKPDVVLVDNMMTSTAGSLGEVLVMQDYLDEIDFHKSQWPGLSWWLDHHPRKGAQNPSVDLSTPQEMYGSRALEIRANTIIRVKGVKDSPLTGQISFHRQKARDSLTPLDLQIINVDKGSLNFNIGVYS